MQIMLKKKLVAAVAGLAMTAGAIALTSSPAAARGGGFHGGGFHGGGFHGGFHGGNWAGVHGGWGPHWHGGGWGWAGWSWGFPYYYYGYPAYYPYGYGYGPDYSAGCYDARRPIYSRRGHVIGYRRIEVCS